MCQIHSFLSRGGSCFKCSKAEFTDDSVKHFDPLSVVLGEPWLSLGWHQCFTFVKTLWSHLMVRVLFGASVQQWTFPKSSHQYDKQKILVKACIDLNAIVLKFKTCFGVARY